mgnify:CR=1 FL=1
MDRWLGTLAGLGRQVPPRVVAGMLRTLTNSGITGRRMQQRAVTCMMGCDAPDAIEHYACCRHTNQVDSTDLWLQPLATENRLPGFLGLLHSKPPEHSQKVRCRAMLTAAAYKLHGWWRHYRGPPLTTEAMGRVLRVQIRELMAGTLADDPLEAAAYVEVN